MRLTFTGVGTALVTPFTRSGSLDQDAVRRLADDAIKRLLARDNCGHPGRRIGHPFACRRSIRQADIGHALDVQLLRSIVSQNARGVNHRDASRVREVAEIFGLSGRLGTVSAALSQGEKKLLDVASAFALDPQVILFDEPTSGVSTADKHSIMKTLLAAAKIAGVRGIVLVEHDMDLVSAYSTRIIALAEGRVLADLTPKKFFADPHLIATVIGKRKAH